MNPLQFRIAARLAGISSNNATFNEDGCFEIVENYRPVQEQKFVDETVDWLRQQGYLIETPTVTDLESCGVQVLNCYQIRIVLEPPQ